ncbi:AzlD domain-containing protein [Salidesulfovibrio onnuriiensis]|uniref:AzlD domain-containing protein n=1 Tax=Salidesulfovibrio onnuriiensis TaxID=2583823 RepID=UPI0011CC21F9|nr:AzlD domain-containing protein [Salidesulfovibrio onnuriiensis]
MEQQVVFFIILGMCAVTYIPRVAPMLVLASRSMPESVVRWLSFVPTAVLSAMLVPAIVSPGGELALDGGNLFLWAGVPAFVLAVWTRSFFGTIALGMAIVAGARYFLM